MAQKIIYLRTFALTLYNASEIRASTLTRMLKRRSRNFA